MKRTAAIIVAILMAFTLFFRDSLARGIVKDSALHAFSNAADRIERALESYPNDQYAVMFACNAIW
jgi:hypothetical protein